MQTRWRLHNLLIDSCLSYGAGTNGPMHTGMSANIQSVSGTTSIIIPFHAIVRPGTVSNPTYMMLSGTTYYGPPLWGWNEYFGTPMFSVQMVDDDDNPILQGTIESYTGSATGNRRISFAPAIPTEVFGIMISVSGGYPTTYVKREFIANYNVKPNGRFVQELVAPFHWEWESTSPPFNTGTLAGGAYSLSGPGSVTSGTMVSHINLMPALSGSGVLYYIETQISDDLPVYPNMVVRTSGWSYWNGPPPPDNFTRGECTIGLDADLTSEYLFIGSSYSYGGGAWTKTYINSVSSPTPFWLIYRKAFTDGAIVFVNKPSSGGEFRLYGAGKGLGTDWYLDETHNLSANFGLADSGNTFRLAIYSVDVYNYCRA